jgi:hypothetical protein
MRRPSTHGPRDDTLTVPGPPSRTHEPPVPARAHRGVPRRPRRGCRSSPGYLPQPSAGRCPHDCVPGPGVLCAIAGGTWATQSAGTPPHRPLRPGRAPRGAWFLGVRTPGCGAWVAVSATARPSRACPAGRGRAGVSPQGTSACTPGKHAADPHARAPRRSPHSGPDPRPRISRAGTHDHPARPALEDSSATTAEGAEPARPQPGRPAAPVRPDKPSPGAGATRSAGPAGQTRTTSRATPRTSRR